MKFFYIFIIFIFVFIYGVSVLSYEKFGEILKPDSGELTRYAISLLTFKYSTYTIVVYAFFASGLGLALSRIAKFRNFLLKFLMYGLMLFGNTVLFLSLGLPEALIISIILIFIFRFVRNILIHDLILALVWAGIIESFILILSPFQALIFFVLMAIFDAFAVYVSRHNTKLIKIMLKAGNFTGFLVPYSLKQLKESTDSLMSTGRVFIIGAFDIVIPIIFSMVVWSFSPIHSLVAFLGSLIGVFFALILSNRQTPSKPVSILSFACFFSLFFYSLYLLTTFI